MWGPPPARLAGVAHRVPRGAGCAGPPGASGTETCRPDSARQPAPCTFPQPVMRLLLTKPWASRGGSSGAAGRGVRRAAASAASRVGPQPSDAWSCGSREGHEAQRSLRSGLSSRAFLRKCPDALRPGAARRELTPPGTLAAPLGSHSLARSPPSCSGFTARGATSPSPFATALHPLHGAVGPSGAQRGQRVSLAVADQWHAARRGGRVPVAPGPPLPLTARVTRPRPASSLSSHGHRRVPCAPGAAGGARGARGAAALGRGRGSRGAASSLGGGPRCRPRTSGRPGPHAARLGAAPVTSVVRGFVLPPRTYFSAAVDIQRHVVSGVQHGGRTGTYLGAPAGWSWFVTVF